MSKQLLVVTDDFGACKQIDDGIIASVGSGNVDCVDAFVTFRDYSEEAIHNFKVFKAEEELQSGKLKMGLHLTLTAGFPVGDHEERFRKLITKASTGEFWPITRQQIDYLWKHFAEELKVEMEAQYNRFIHIYGEAPKHASCHEGFFHLSEELTKIYFDFAREKNLFIRNPKLLSTIGAEAQEWNEKTPMIIRATRNATSVGANVGLIDGDGKAMMKWGRDPDKLKKAVDEARKIGLITTDYFIDHFYGAGNIGNLESIFKRIGDGHTYEMVSHPVYYSHFEDFSTPSGIDKSAFPDRLNETGTLTSTLFSQLREAYGIEHYDWPSE